MSPIKSFIETVINNVPGNMDGPITFDLKLSDGAMVYAGGEQKITFTLYMESNLKFKQAEAA